jgi:hypothetical protein
MKATKSNHGKLTMGIKEPASALFKVVEPTLNFT